MRMQFQTKKNVSSSLGLGSLGTTVTTFEPFVLDSGKDNSAKIDVSLLQVYKANQKGITDLNAELKKANAEKNEEKGQNIAQQLAQRQLIRDTLESLSDIKRNKTAAQIVNTSKPLVDKMNKMIGNPEIPSNILQSAANTINAYYEILGGKVRLFEVAPATTELPMFVKLIPVGLALFSFLK